MKGQFFVLSFLILLALGPSACVGPTTPFGVVVNMEKEEPKTSILDHELNRRYQIRFHPERQILHDKTDFSIEIKSQRPIPKDIRLQVTHNRRDVTEAFLRNSFVHRANDQKTLIYSMKNLRLRASDPNDIQVRLIDTAGIVINQERFEEPECSLFANRKLAHLGDFSAPAYFLPLIETVAESSQMNPSFLAGIVAQESGFDPQAVSWAKAIGLTQMTPVAEKQVLSRVEKWPRHPGINDLSYLTLRTKIFLGEIDQKTEWRLDPEKSLVGGVTYINYLKDYWTLETNKEMIQSLDGEFNDNLTEIILASYNSGAARVKKALKSRQDQWKQEASLKEAVNYLRKVRSYCFHYTHPEKKSESET